MQVTRSEQIRYRDNTKWKCFEQVERKGIEMSNVIINGTLISLYLPLLSLSLDLFSFSLSRLREDRGWAWPWLSKKLSVCHRKGWAGPDLTPRPIQLAVGCLLLPKDAGVVSVHESSWESLTNSWTTNEGLRREKTSRTSGKFYKGK